jgi:hypothetical protein
VSGFGVETGLNPDGLFGREPSKTAPYLRAIQPWAEIGWGQSWSLPQSLRTGLAYLMRPQFEALAHGPHLYIRTRLRRGRIYTLHIIHYTDTSGVLAQGSVCTSHLTTIRQGNEVWLTETDFCEASLEHAELRFGKRTISRLRHHVCVLYRRDPFPSTQQGVARCEPRRRLEASNVQTAEAGSLCYTTPSHGWLWAHGTPVRKHFQRSLDSRRAM